MIKKLVPPGATRHAWTRRRTSSGRPMGPYPLCADHFSVLIPARNAGGWAWVRIDADFLQRAVRHAWRLGKDGYPVTTVWDVVRRQATHLPLHRLVMNAAAGTLVDHIDGDRLDARRSMLRLATASQNSANRRVSRLGRSSKFRGVTLHRGTGRWQAGAKHREEVGGVDRFHYAGLFKSQEEAARAYDVLARRLFGAFAVTNFPAVESERRAA